MVDSTSLTRIYTYKIYSLYKVYMLAGVWDRYSKEAAFFNRSERRLDFVYDHIR